MKKLKQALSLSLALALSIVLAAPTSAADQNGSVYEDNHIKITNVVEIGEHDPFYGLMITCDAPVEITLMNPSNTFGIDRETSSGDWEDVPINIASTYVGYSGMTIIDVGATATLAEPGLYSIMLASGGSETLKEPPASHNLGGPSFMLYQITVRADSSEQPSQPSTPSEPTTPVVPADGAYEVSTSAGNGLNVRTGPGTNYKKAAPALREGTVIEVVEIQGQWGKLANDAGWVFMPGTKAVSEPAAPVTPAEPAEPTVELPVTLQVSTSAGKGLNVRTGPGTNYKLASAALREGTVIEVVEIDGQWGKLADDAGWVFLPGTKAVKG